MHIFSDISDSKKLISELKQAGHKIAFVPTMGNLHEGHLTLVRQAKADGYRVVVSIFVNPMQFERAEDLINYPRTLENDLNKLETESISLVFTPTPEGMYPNGMKTQTFVEVPELSYTLEGASRPGHFRGVATVVTKLFNIIQPDIAYFGEKDFQQLAIIRRMVDDLCLDINIVGVPTVRESDGLAMSSRNGRLTEQQRQQAPELARSMNYIHDEIYNGRRDFNLIIEEANQQLQAAGFCSDELFVCDADTLEIATPKTTHLVILMSAFLGKIRLIDNRVFKLKSV